MIRIRRAADMVETGKFRGGSVMAGAVFWIGYNALLLNVFDDMFMLLFVCMPWLC